MILVLCILITIIIGLIGFFKHRYKYWSSLGIPGPKPIFLLGNLADTTKNTAPPPLQIKKWTEEFGKVYGYYDGIRKILVTSDLDMMQDLFIKQFDNFYGRKTNPLVGDVDTEPLVHVFNARGLRWKRLRTLGTPAFSTGNLKKIRPTVEDSVFEMIKLLEKNVDGEAVNMLEFYQEYTMDVISRVAMGQMESRLFDNKFTQPVLAMFNQNIFASPSFLAANIMPSLTSVIRKFHLIYGSLFGTVPFVELAKSVRTAVENRISERNDGITNDSDTVDFIDLFLDSQVDEVLEEEEGFSKAGAKISRVMTKDEIVAQCMVFLLAGFDTTANSLSYVSYLIAKHPRVLKKMQEEIDEVCMDTEISYETLGKLTYMDYVVREGLRLYPIAAFASSRECMVPTTLGGIPIEKGTLVVADVWSVHYSKEIWGEDADEFKPERWDSEERRCQLSWLPFGAGPRQCIGMRLAYLEEKLALAHILRKFDIVQGEKTEESLKLTGSFTTSPEAVHLYLKSRNI